MDVKATRDKGTKSHRHKGKYQIQYERNLFYILRGQ